MVTWRSVEPQTAPTDRCRCKQTSSRWFVVAAGLVLSLVGSTLAQAPANDSCTTPTPIYGSGTFSFDTTLATTGAEGQLAQSCIDQTGSAPIENDVWFCWTSDCPILAEIDTCFQTNVDTKIAFHRGGCGCPSNNPGAFCCDDDSCGLQSDFTCEAQCCQSVLIQIGNKPGATPGPGTFTIGCTTPQCGGGNVQACCFQSGACGMLAPQCCAQQGGTPMGTGSSCLGDIDGDGHDDLCVPPPTCNPLPGVFGCSQTICPNPAVERCIPTEVYCDAAGNCMVTDCDCENQGRCKLEFNGPGAAYCKGGCPVPPGGNCKLQTVTDATGGQTLRCDCLAELDEACCLPNGTCIVALPSECQQLGGTPLGAGSACEGVEACCYPDAAGNLVCQDMDALCCKKFFNGSPQGPGNLCLGDSNSNGIDDQCEPPGCQTPPIGAVDCPPVVCPVKGDKCQAKCIDHDPTTGQYSIAECDCRGGGECHAEFIPGTPEPYCTGPCGTGLKCVKTTSQVPGTNIIRTCCDCDDVPPDVCEPLSDLSACNGADCPVTPIGPQQCQPRCLRFDPATGQTLFIECDCRYASQCHPVPSTLVPPLEPRCVGFCPPGETCKETRTVDPLTGMVDICCDCERFCPVQDPTNPADPCAALQTRDCINGGPNDTCLPVSIVITQGQQGANVPTANSCSCDPGLCGPVTVYQIPGTNDFALECHGGCPPPQIGVCQPFLNGSPQGLISLVASALSVGDVVTCDCHDDTPPPCPTPQPAAVDICGPRQQSDCQNGSAGDLCLPTSVNWNPQTGAVTALGCECRSDTECHVNPGGGGVPPSCSGVCPSTGEQCTPHKVPDGNGGFNFECDCCVDNSISISLNTGEANGGGLIPFGNADDTWTLVSEPPPVGILPRPATVINAHSAWLTFPGSRWISGNATGPNGFYEYEFCFCLAETYQNASLTFQLRSDDQAWVYFNGNYLLGPAGTGFNAMPPIGLSLIGFFRPGQNCLNVIVENTHGVVTGLNLIGQVDADNAQCCCEPEPDARSCKKTTCENPNDICKPTEVVYDPLTGQYEVTKCDCTNPDECYMALSTVVPPGPPTCQGLVCPGTGQACNLTATMNADGTTTYDCCTAPPACDPLPGVFGCAPIVCPDPTDKCIPTQVYCDAAGTCTVVDCDCTGQTRCKLHFNGPTHPYCEGDCPIPGLDCKLQNIPDAVGGHTLRCDCLGGADEACCLPNGTCIVTLPGDCQAQGGTPLGVGTACQGIEACCYPDAAGNLICQDMDAACCKQFFHGTPQGAGNLCQGDNNGNGIDDQCEPPGCQPPPVGALNCPPVVCPIQGDKCQSKCIDFDPATGQYSIAECDCRGGGQCHAEYIPGTPEPICVGPCEQGLTCVRTTTPIPGTNMTRTCCDCDQEPVDQCEPLPDQSACNGFMCPPTAIGPKQCQPRCLRFNPATGQTLYIDCDCTYPDKCHAVASTLVPPLEPSCAGLCPPGKTCKETRTVDPLTGMVDVCCDCDDLCRLPDPTNPADPCAGLQSTDCVNGGPNDTCLPTSVVITTDPLGVNVPVANSCSCEPGLCGPVTIFQIPGSNDFALECHGACPPPEIGICQPFLNGNPQGLVSLVASALNPGDVVTCDCYDDPPPVCPTELPPAADICGPLQMQQCRDGSADDTCFPTRVHWDPMTGSTTAITCECIPDSKCHVNTGIAPAAPTCVGVCPTTGEQCTTNLIPNGDGTYEVSCDCCSENDVSLILNTGWYNTGGFIPYGNDDDTWSVVSEPPPFGVLPRPAKVINAHSAWLTQPNSRWISGNATGPNGFYEYEFCFCLAETYQNASLTFQLRSDDQAWVYFNGNYLLGPAGTGFNTAVPIGLSVIGFFRPGQNCLNVVVENTHGVVTGLNLIGQVNAENAQCCCEPAPNGLACEKTICPNSSEICRPTELVFDPATGQTRVTKCDCVNPDQCYLEVEEPGVYFCAGLVCPETGATCQHTSTVNPDGTVTHSCCAPPPPGCEPDPVTNTCPPTVCPNPGDICKPTEINYNPITGVFTVTKCDCRNPDECYLDASAGFLQCEGLVCPDTGAPCAMSQFKNPDHTLTYRCCQGEPPVCEPLPDHTSCRPTTCPGGAMEKCLPTVIGYDMATGQSTVLNCDCANETICHVAIGAAGPICIGGCPLSGTVCAMQRRDTNGDGVPDAFACDCRIICDDPLDCTDLKACSCDRCVEGACDNAPNEFGNADCSGIVELGDVLCVLNGYADVAACPNGDVDPPCTGNDPPFIELGDVLAILAAYNGADPCNCPP